MLGIQFDTRSLTDLADDILTNPVKEGEGLRTIVTCNMDHVVQLRENERFRAAYQKAWCRTVDGTPVYIWTRFRLGSGYPKVPGSDLFKELMDRAAPGLNRFFYLASSEDVGRALVEKMVQQGLSADSLAWFCPPHGFENLPGENERLLNAINDFNPTHIFMGVGAPKSEIWAEEHRSALADSYVLSCGASLEFYVGMKERAPKWMQTWGLEWLHRLSSEPKRLGKRYLINSWGFLAAIIEDWRGKTLY